MQVISGRFSHLERISSLRWVENIENQLKKKIYPEIKTEVQVSNFFKEEGHIFYMFRNLDHRIKV